jgi:hypothetical protein
VRWIGGKDLKPVFQSIPAQFVTLFDHVFGDQHLSWQCFRRSSIASVAAVALVLLIIMSSVGGPLAERLTAPWEPDLVVGLLLACGVNILLDYLSLLETRILVRWADKSSDGQATSGAYFSTETALVVAHAKGYQRLAHAVMVDLAATVMLSMLTWGVLGAELRDLWPDSREALISTAAAVGLASSFFTSVWLWLYTGSVLLSHALVRMSAGVGSLLRLTDLERQPFRSLGFVSVIIASTLFAAGLPAVLV